MKETKEVGVLSVKGAALISAVEAGLLPKIDGGWDDTGFERFWELFEPDLRKQIEEESHNFRKIRNHKPKQTGDSSTNNSVENRLFRLELAVSRLIGFLIGSFLAYFVSELLKLG